MQLLCLSIYVTKTDLKTPLPSFICAVPLNLQRNFKRLLMHDKALDPHDFQAKGEHPSCAGSSFPQKQGHIACAPCLNEGCLY